MEAVLKEKFWNYIVEHNPELMFSLQENYSVMRYLEEKMAGIAPLLSELKESGMQEYQISEQCMAVLTEELRPSRYNYIRSLLESEFEQQATEMRESGTLTFEVVGMIEACEGIFTEMGFSEEHENDRLLQYAVIGQIDTYLKAAKESI